MTDSNTGTTEAEQRRAQWHREHEESTGLGLCSDCTALLANGEHYAEGSEYPTLEALVAAQDKQWPSAEGWNLDYAGCLDPSECEHEDGEDEDGGPCEHADRWHIDFTWSHCDGCGSRLGGGRCVGYAWRKRRKCHACVKSALLRSPRVCDNSACVAFPRDSE